MPSPLCVAVLGDHEPSRFAMRDAVIAAGEAIAGTWPCTIEARQEAIASRPDLVLVGLEEPAARALAALEQVAGALPAAVIAAYSSDSSTRMFQQAVRAGASHLISFPAPQGELHRLFAACRRAGASPASMPRGRVVAVIGQKGGIGKTTVSVNLGAALASLHHQSVCVIDFDTRFGDTAISLDVKPESTAAQAANSIANLDRFSLQEMLAQHESGAFVLAAPASTREWVNTRPEDLDRVVALAETMFDYVILDTPGAFNEAVEVCISRADNLLIVTSMEITSAKNAAMLLSLLQQEGDDGARVVLLGNHTFEETGLGATDIAPVLDRDAIWSIPYDPDMRHAGQVGRTLVMVKPESPAARSLLALARRLVESPDHIERRAKLRPDAPAVRSQRSRWRGLAAALKLAS